MIRVMMCIIALQHQEISWNYKQWHGSSEDEEQHKICLICTRIKLELPHTEHWWPKDTKAQIFVHMGNTYAKNLDPLILFYAYSR